MDTGNLSTEILTQIISGFLLKWSETDEFDHPTLCQLRGVSQHWRAIVERLMVQEIGAWPAQKFVLRFKNAAHDGDILMVRLAYDSGNVPLLLAPVKVDHLLGGETSGMVSQHNCENAVAADTGPYAMTPPFWRSLEMEALCIAAARGQAVVVAFLVERGVDVHSTYPLFYPNQVLDEWNLVNAEAALAFNKSSEANMAREATTWETPLYANAQWGQGDETMRLLLSRGADVKSTWPNRGRTALFGAIRSLPRVDGDAEHLSSVLAKTRLLLEHKTDPMISTHDKESVLHCAYQCGYKEVRRLLHDPEPKLYMSISWGLTPLAQAYIGIYSRAARMLQAERSHKATDSSRHASESSKSLVSPQTSPSPGVWPVSGPSLLTSYARDRFGEGRGGARGGSMLRSQVGWVGETGPQRGGRGNTICGGRAGDALRGAAAQRGRGTTAQRGRGVDAQRGDRGNTISGGSSGEALRGAAAQRGRGVDAQRGRGVVACS